MIRILTTLIFAALLSPAWAQSLTTPQLQALCAAVKASPTANALRMAGNSTGLEAWLNTPASPTQLAWHTAAPLAAIEEAPNYTSYDTLATGKRDSWLVLLRSERDFTRAKVRNWVVDVWGPATSGSNAEVVLLAATYSASNGQAALGGVARTTGTVSALDLAWPRAIPGSAADWMMSPANCQ